MEEDELSPWMQHHRQFLEEYRQSHKAVYRVAHFYRYWGRSVFLPPIKMAPTPDQAHNFRDDFDLQLIYRGNEIGMGVKHIRHQFAGPPGSPRGFPFRKVVVGKVRDVDDHMLDHVQQWALVSMDLSTMVVSYAKDRARWFIEPLRDSITGLMIDHYFIDVEFCEFYALEGPAKLNDEDLRPIVSLTLKPA